MSVVRISLLHLKTESCKNNNEINWTLLHLKMEMLGLPDWIHNSDALVRAWSQTSKARLWKFNGHNRGSLVQCVDTDLRCKTVGL